MARKAAGEQLATFIRNLSSERHGTDVWIVAHSHGGNVALYALDHLSDEEIDGMVCLATPFLHFGPQHLNFLAFRLLPLSIAFVIFVLCVGAGILAFDRWNPQLIDQAPGIVSATGLVAGFLASLAAHRLMARFDIDSRIQRSDEMAQSYQPSMPKGQTKLLILRNVGDEASAALGSGRFVEVILSLLWKVLLLPMVVPLNLLKRVPNVLRKHPWIIGVGFVSLIAVILLGADAFLNASGYAILGAVLLVLVTSAVQIICLCSILVINLVRFGMAKGIGSTMLIRMTGEATPLGSWEVELFEGRGFAHSELYDNEAVGRRILHAIQEDTRC